MSKTGDIVTIKMTDDPNNSDFEYMAHRRGDTQKDMFYVGAYLGYVENNKLRSLSGKTPSNNYTIGTFRTYARNNTPASDENGGSGYDQSGFYQLTYRQAMYVLKYKNLNSQAIVGNGNSNNAHASGQLDQQNTGGTNTKGMDWGETTDNKQQMKLFGIEDFWGNLSEYIEGMSCDPNRNIFVGTQGFNDTGSGYKNCGNGGVTSPTGGYMSKIQGTTELGFLLKAGDGAANGSDTTYYCDQAQLANNDSIYYLASSGRGSINAYVVPKGTGVFNLMVQISSSRGAADGGARLMYL